MKAIHNNPTYQRAVRVGDDLTNSLVKLSRNSHHMQQQEIFAGLRVIFNDGKRCHFDQFENDFLETQRKISSLSKSLEKNQKVLAAATSLKVCTRFLSLHKIFEWYKKQEENEIAMMCQQSRYLKNRVKKGKGDKTSQNQKREKILREKTDKQWQLNVALRGMKDSGEIITTQALIAKIKIAALRKKKNGERYQDENVREFFKLVEHMEQTKVKLFSQNETWLPSLANKVVQRAFDTLIECAEKNKPSCLKLFCRFIFS